MQRQILDTLDEAKNTELNYRGCSWEQNWMHPDTWRWDRPGWVIYHRQVIRLAPGVYDLRASAMYVAQQNGMVYSAGFIQPCFQAAFSRAVKSLLGRKLIKAPTTIPLAEYDEDQADSELILELADGIYLDADRRQRQMRFVVKC